MSNNELEQLKGILLDEQQLNIDHLENYAETYRMLKTIYDDPHKEFPTWQKHLQGVLDKTQDDFGAYLRTLPLQFEANSQALLKIILRNNERLLRLIELTKGV
jgi:hypothetical protein